MNKKLKTRKDYYIKGFKYMFKFGAVTVLLIAILEFAEYVNSLNNPLYSSLFVLGTFIVGITLIFETIYQNDKYYGEAE